jgi:hypothetical protein
MTGGHKIKKMADQLMRIEKNPFRRGRFKELLKKKN